MCHTSFFTSRALLKKNLYTSKDTYYDVADWDYCFDLRDLSFWNISEQEF